MKYIIILPLIFYLSCKTNNTYITNDKISTQSTVCPEDGSCSFNIERGNSLVILKDEFGNSYPEFKESGDYLFVFEYKRNEIPGTADSNYTEKILIQFNPKSPEIQLKGKDLKEANVAFARLCFCKGQTGYYAIEDGELEIVQVDKNTYNLSLEFACNEVPQVITKISEIFTLD